MITDYLSKSERFACIKAGALMHVGDVDAEFGPQMKSAGDDSVVGTAKNVVDAGKSLWLLAALGTGIPLGVFSHIMGRRIAGKRLREEELREKIRMYQMASDEMAAGLPGGSV